MKTIMTKPIIILAVATLWFGAFAQAQNEQSADNTTQPASPPAAAPAPQSSGGATNGDDQQQAVGALIQAVVDAQQAAADGQTADGGTNKLGEAQSPRSIRGQGARGTAGSSTNAISLTALVAKQPTTHTATATNTFLLNFRNAPLSLVLDYLSAAAGFTISANSKVDLKGAVTVWSNQPVGRDAAVRILQKALSEHSYAATVEGNVLNIYVVDSSNAEIIAGIPGNEYTNIPATKDLVTQIVYVRNVEATPLIQTLQPLMPNGTGMTANQGANAIVITDTKANIRRMAQLVKALDTASVSASTVRVFPLTYADATALAQVVQQLFPGATANATQGGPFPGFFGRFGGGGNRGQPESSSSTVAGRVAAAKVVAAADDRSNSLIVSASEEQMALVKELVDQVDVNVDDVTELRVFHLLYADPQETADQLTSLFPDPTTQQTSSGRQSGFRGFNRGFNRGGNPGAPATDPNSRLLRQTRVTAVPDPRTGSVIVSAARDLMEQIAGIIERLDSDPAKKKKVYVIKVENRDPQEVVQDLQSVIATDGSGNFGTRSSSQQSGGQLNTRQQNNLRNTGNNNNTFGTSGSRTGR